MSQIYQYIDNVGLRENTTLATSTAQKVFASVSGYTPPTHRQGVNLVNQNATATLYVKFVPYPASTPSFSTTDFDIAIPALGDRQIQVGPGVAIYVWQNSGSTSNYAALELI